MANQSTFWFAWCSSTETTFNSSHQREDELIFSFTLRHEEGQFAELEMEIVNPHIGLLAPGRPFWAWFSWSDGSGVYPLFFGRLVGIPSDLFADIITIKLVAKPKNYAEQRVALAASLQVAPYWDPIFIDEKKRDDPDVVLEGYSALWHVDRTTHLLTISDLIAGEDGVEEFTPNDVFYDDMSVTLAEAPLMVCEIDASVSWVQADHTGVIDFKNEVFRPLSGALAEDLSKIVSVGDGYLVRQGLNPDGTVAVVSGGGGSMSDSFSFKNQSKGPHEDGDLMSCSGSVSATAMPGGFITENTIQTMGTGSTTQSVSYTHPDKESGQGEEYSISISSSVNVTAVDRAVDALSVPTPSALQIGVEVAQDRRETIHVRVLADVQPILTEATEDEDSIKETLSMDAEDVVAAGAASSSDGAYFPTERGLQSLEYLLLVARAHLLARSRAVEISWGCKFARVVSLSCRKNATIEDSRLPGGIVLGKIVAYEMTGNGDDGEFLGNVTINSAIGYGNAITLAAGTPDYCATDYVDGYQHYSGRFVAAVTNDMTFSPLAYEATGIQLPISKDQLLVRHEWHDAGQVQSVQDAVNAANTGAKQRASLGELEGDTAFMQSPSVDVYSMIALQANAGAGINQAIRDNPAWLELELKPVQNISTDVEYDAEVSPLVIPMQINLSA